MLNPAVNIIVPNNIKNFISTRLIKSNRPVKGLKMSQPKVLKMIKSNRYIVSNPKMNKDMIT